MAARFFICMGWAAVSGLSIGCWSSKPHDGLKEPSEPPRVLIERQPAGNEPIAEQPVEATSLSDEAAAEQEPDVIPAADSQPAASIAPIEPPPDIQEPTTQPVVENHTPATQPNISLTVDELAEKLSRRIQDNPHEISGHLDYQLLQFLRNEPVPQLSAISTLSAEDREVVTAILEGLSNFRAAARADGNMLLSKKIRPLLDMADRLRGQAELSIPTISLCRRVDGYGVYETIEPARFFAGREQPMILYCEVANFSPQLNDQKLWETNLSQEVVLYAENGLAVWPEQSQPTMITDLSRNRRHDFFLAKKINLPANLTTGRYLLKVSIVDKQANRLAEATTPIQIVAE